MEESEKMSQINKKSGNYLDLIPIRREHMLWSIEENGLVTLDVENSGIFHWFAQRLFHKPKISHIHLDPMGSFVWCLIDGSRDIFSLSASVKEQFGEEAAPLYERLSKYFHIRQSYGFISFKK